MAGASHSAPQRFLSVSSLGPYHAAGLHCTHSSHGPTSFSPCGFSSCSQKSLAHPDAEANISPLSYPFKSINKFVAALETSSTNLSYSLSWHSDHSHLPVILSLSASSPNLLHSVFNPLLFFTFYSQSLF